MMKAGHDGVEFRGTWRDAIENYYTQNPKKAGHNVEISCKNGALVKISSMEE